MTNRIVLAGKSPDENEKQYGIRVDGKYILTEGEFAKKYPIGKTIDFENERRALVDWSIALYVDSLNATSDPIHKLYCESSIKFWVAQLEAMKRKEDDDASI